MLGMLGQTTEYAALPEQWSDWKITDRIGAGSFGTVYRVQKIDEPVCVGAIKVIQIPIDDTETEILLREYHNEESILNYYRELAEEYKREIDILNSLKFCPNIVFCQDCCIEPRENAPGWNLYVLMEHLISFDVHCLHTELNEAKVIQIGLDICSALSTCHAKGILHRDIKPDNILVSRSGEYKLADFGMAKNISKTYGTMSIKGTFSYMAPEIYTGQKYNSRADIYSLGLVLYRLMNHNREPFVNTQKQVIYYKDKEEALSRRMGGEELPAPLDASLEFSEIILKACAFNPQERYSNADALLADLQKLSRGEYRCKKRKQKTHNRTIKRKQMITLLSVILIAAFCITVIFSYRSHHEIASGTCGENISYSLRENNCLYIHGTGALNSIGSFDSISARITTVIIEPGITSIGDYALKDLTFLQRVSIPDTVTEIGSCAFQNCSSLVKANIPDSVTTIGSWAFQGCSSLKHITLSENITVIPTACFSDCSSLIKVNIPNDVIFIGTYAFWKCTSLNDILIPENVKIIHDSAFFNCSSLKEITLPNSIQNIGANAFHGCTSLTEVTLPANLSRIKDSTFSFCFSLYRVTIPDSVTMIEEYAFQNCTSLIEIFIPNSVDTIENFAFADCTSLSKASLPVHAVPDRAIFLFSNCTSLSEIVLLKTDSSIEIEPKLFLGFTSLQSITIPEGIIKIGDCAFFGCSSLQNLTIPDSVTKIGFGAFSDCSSLQNLTIPDSV
ncbi:MAG: leucine-rich repeat protein, partial [Eubacteriales bacterium]|nr:leucine-rich repeat protein [Eubacteriales bacterium]